LENKNFDQIIEAIEKNEIELNYDVSTFVEIP
jgi:hypothetical protein